MKNRIISVALATVAIAALVGVAATAQTVRSAAAITAPKVAEKADNFRLIDQNSKAHELYYFKNSAAVVIISQANGSKFVKDAAPAIAALKAKYAGQNVQFFLMNSSPDAKRDSIAAEMKTVGLDIPVLMDDSQLIGESLGVTRAAEAFVIDPKGWKVVYHGPIDDRFAGKSAKPAAKVKTAYVANALDAMLASKPIAVSTAKLDSPLVAFPERDRQAEHVNISYSKDVAPVISKNCVACHTEKGIAPFAMNRYEQVKAFAPMIREALRTDRMPPYNADPHVGKLAGDMNLSTQDMKTIVHWIEAGAQRGTGDDPLLINAKPAPEWELGEPDLIITLPSFKVPASGVIDYQNPVVMNPLTEGRWLRASQVKPSDRQAVHHLLSNGVGGYAVGSETTVYTKGTGTWVAPGQKFQFQMHYTPYGKETTETTRVGLYFYPKDAPPELMRRSAVVLNVGIEIPAGEARHQETAYITFPADATLYSLYPHGHYRAENMAISLQRPGQKEELILALPKYDFNWQRAYDFETPIQIPAGSKIITRYQYDNSKNNTANPDPTINVTWGEQSWEEMQYTAMGFRWNDETVADQKPEHMTALNATRVMGMIDSNIDGKVQKTELHGRLKMLLANFDQMDADKDGTLDEKELTPISGMLGRRIAEGQAQQSVGQ